MAKRRPKGIDSYLEERRKELERLGRAMGGSKPTKKPAPTRKVQMSPAGKRRAGSVGVSSSSRQRTHRRGPHNR